MFPWNLSFLCLKLLGVVFGFGIVEREVVRWCGCGGVGCVCDWVGGLVWRRHVTRHHEAPHTAAWWRHHNINMVQVLVAVVGALLLCVTAQSLQCDQVEAQYLDCIFNCSCIYGTNTTALCSSREECVVRGDLCQVLSLTKGKKQLHSNLAVLVLLPIARGSLQLHN